MGEINRDITPNRCPCCGGYARLEQVLIKPVEKFKVYCTACKLSTWLYLTAEKAIYMWNTRQV